MVPDQTAAVGHAIAEFEQALGGLVLEYFGRGVPVEGTWDITTPLAETPDWAVVIEKTYSERPSTYRPEFIDDE